MGEIAEAMLEGFFCEGCGEVMGDPLTGESQGFPGLCAGCRNESGLRVPLPLHQRKVKPEGGAKWSCKICSKGLRTKTGLNQHMTDKHKSPQLQHSDFIAALMPFAQFYARLVTAGPPGAVADHLEIFSSQFGGITCGELRAARDIVERGTGTKVEP